jgi:hypothetical protein
MLTCEHFVFCYSRNFFFLIVPWLQPPAPRAQKLMPVGGTRKSAPCTRVAPVVGRPPGLVFFEVFCFGTRMSVLCIHASEVVGRPPGLGFRLGFEI